MKRYSITQYQLTSFLLHFILKTHLFHPSYILQSTYNLSIKTLNLMSNLMTLKPSNPCDIFM